MIYTKTIYIDVEADDEVDAMNHIFANLENVTEDDPIKHVDFDGPIEERPDLEGQYT